MKYESIIAAMLRKQNASDLSLRGPLKVDFTVKELAALHLAGQHILEIAPEIDEGGVLARSVKAAQDALVKHGCRLNSQGWIA